MGYIMDLRKELGHRPIILTGAGAYLVNEKNEILLGKRADDKLWDHPGGSLELGESFEEACRREVFEETGLTCGKLEFLTDFSGKDTHHIYPNGDECYIAGIIYICFDYSGEMKPQEEEVIEQRFFALDDLPEDIEVRQLPVIEKVRQYLKDLGRL